MPKMWSSIILNCMYQGLVYRAFCKTTQKSYIGETTWTLLKRKQKHVDRAKSGLGTEKFMRALRKYGITDFEWSELELLEAKTLSELETLLHLKERYYIDTFDSIANGYNILYGRRNQGGCAGKFNPAYVSISIPKEEFITLCKRGMTRKKLATHFNVPFNHIRIFLERLYQEEPELKIALSKRQYEEKRHNKSWRPEIFEKIKILTANNLGIKAIASEMGLSYGTVRSYKRHL